MRMLIEIKRIDLDSTHVWILFPIDAGSVSDMEEIVTNFIENEWNTQPDFTLTDFEDGWKVASEQHERGIPEQGISEFTPFGVVVIDGYKYHISVKAFDRDFNVYRKGYCR